MKLRRNSRLPIEFHAVDVFNPKYGIKQSDWDQLMLHLVAIRDDLVAAEPVTLSFLGLPERLLAESIADRRSSELSRLFRRASFLHTIVDRVLVLGCNATIAGARAILESCCQPHWNELSRADRGSKPRIYFGGDGFDNDATQGLLHLFDAHKSKKVVNEKERWALAVIEQQDETLSVTAAFRQFLSALEVSIGPDPELIRKLLVPVANANSNSCRILEHMMLEIDDSDRFPIPMGIHGPFAILTAAGLVPAALIGVNVVELLQGAAALTKHFSISGPEENVVLKYVAANHLMAKSTGSNTRIMNVEGNALLGFGRWYETLAAERLRFIPQTMLSGQVSMGALSHGPNKIYNHIQVENVRFDPLCDGFRAGNAVQWNEKSSKSFPELEDEGFKESLQSLGEIGIPSTKMILSRVDELHMGQLFQMMMLTTVVEERLLLFPIPPQSVRG